MPKLIGTGNNQVPTNAMLGGMAFQSPEDVQVDKLQENRFDVVTQTDIGTAPNQIPLNQMLGLNAYTNIIYQEVTFTPDFVGQGGHAYTFASRSGLLTRIGNLITIQVSASFRLSSANGQNITMNLPVASNTTTSSRAACEYSNITQANMGGLIAYINTSTGNLFFNRMNISGSAIGNLDGLELSTSSDTLIAFTMTYRAAP
jgi:hypothetical protein